MTTGQDKRAAALAALDTAHADARAAGIDNDPHWAWRFVKTEDLNEPDYGDSVPMRQMEALATTIREALAAPDARVAELDGVGRIAAERRRQIEQEGWTADHDTEHDSGELSGAGTAYADYASRQIGTGISRGHPMNNLWRWESKWWKPSDDPIRNLEKAGALIAAEIDRLAALAPGEPKCSCGGTPSYGGVGGHEFSASCTCCRDICGGTGIVGGEPKEAN